MKNARLAAAVHNANLFSRSGLWERLFTWWFSGLVYPQIWEDPELDLAALEITPESRIVAIASGGCNVMNYLVADPKEILAVDLNVAHAALTKLKCVAAERLPSYESFFDFFGRADDKANRAAYERHIRRYLDDDARRYWDRRKLFGGARINLFTRNIYKHGLSGHFLGFLHLVARLHGKNPRALLAAQSLEEQREIFRTGLAPLFESWVVRLACRSPVSVIGLGIPPSQYGELAAAGGNMAQVLSARLERLACDFSIKDNYFAWQAFARRYDCDNKVAVPSYLRPENYHVIRARAKRVRVEVASITELLRKEPAASVDRYVLLDAQDWMTADQLVDLWSEITRTARPGARTIFRTAAEQSRLPDVLPAYLLDRWRYDEAECRALIARDRSSVYGGFHVYRLA